MGISLDDEIFDSRDIMEKIAELQGQIDALQEDLEDVDLDESANNEICDEIDELTDELEIWMEFACAFSGCSDWEYGETIIRVDHFVDYIKELILGCYPMPQDLESWPWRHLEMDWEGASEDAQIDYVEEIINGWSYFCRA